MRKLLFCGLAALLMRDALSDAAGGGSASTDAAAKVPKTPEELSTLVQDHFATLEADDKRKAVIAESDKVINELGTMVVTSTSSTISQQITASVQSQAIKIVEDATTKALDTLAATA